MKNILKNNGNRLKKQKFFSLLSISIAVVLIGVIFKTSFSMLLVSTGIVFILLLFIAYLIEETRSRLSVVQITFIITICILAAYFIFLFNGFITVSDMNEVVRELLKTLK